MKEGEGGGTDTKKKKMKEREGGGTSRTKWSGNQNK